MLLKIQLVVLNVFLAMLFKLDPLGIFALLDNVNPYNILIKTLFVNHALPVVHHVPVNSFVYRV